MAEHKLRTRSFRDEDYGNRRVFLRSYPLQWGGEEDEEEKIEEKAKVKKKKKPIKKIIVAVFNWGDGKVVVLRKFKHKIAFYVIACIPVGLKRPTALISH